jgi:hypothetical protein
MSSQSLSGTGALFLGFKFLKTHLGCTKVLLPNPTWRLFLFGNNVVSILLQLITKTLLKLAFYLMKRIHIMTFLITPSISRTFIHPSPLQIRIP